MPVHRAPLARSRLDPNVTDFHRIGGGPDIPRELLQSRWVPSTYRRAFRSPITLRAVSRSQSSKRLARCRGSSPLRVASPSCLRRQAVASRASQGQGRTSNVVQEHLRDRSREEPLPRPAGARDTSCRQSPVSRVGAREEPPTGQGPLCMTSREGRRALPHPKCLSSVDTPEGAEGRRASSTKPSAPLLPCPSRALDCA
jgi:hypothetical protein